MTKASSTVEFEDDGAPRLTIDWELYAELLEDSDLTDVEKKEFIETLWSLVVSFVDLGFEISSESRIENVLPHEMLEALTEEQRRSSP